MATDTKTPRRASELVYTTADRSRIVAEDDPDAALQFSLQDAERLGVIGPGKSRVANPLDVEVELLRAAQERGATGEVAVRKHVLERDHGAQGIAAVQAFDAAYNPALEPPPAAAGAPADYSAGNTAASESEEEDGEDPENPRGPTVPEVLDEAAAVTDPAEIQRLIDSESAQEKPRKSLLEGLEKRKQALSSPPEDKSIPGPPETK